MKFAEVATTFFGGEGGLSLQPPGEGERVGGGGGGVLPLRADHVTIEMKGWGPGDSWGCEGRGGRSCQERRH